MAQIIRMRLPSTGIGPLNMPDLHTYFRALKLLGNRALERDKLQHLLVSYALILAFLALLGNIAMAVAGTLALGLIKEIWDKYQGSGFCWYDMLANALGAGAGAATIVALNG